MFLDTSKNTRIVLILSLIIISLVLDHYTQPIIKFPVLFVIPLFLSAWYLGKAPSIAVGIAMEGASIYFDFGQITGLSSMGIMFFILVRIAFLTLFILLVDRISQQQREIKTLRGILPICSHCKKIRNEQNGWINVEEYIDDHSDASFSHGICPDCMRKYYGSIEKKS